MVKINIDMPKSCEYCPLLCEDDNLDYCCCVDNSIDVDCEARAENCPLTPLEAQPKRCDSCIHSEERDGSNCYECVKNMADNFEAHPTSDDEIIKALKAVRVFHNGNYAPQIDEAIRRLEAQPTDVVSREEALLALTGMDLPTDRDKLIALFTERIQHLPSVTPTNEDIKGAYLKGYDYGVKDWFKSKTQPSEDCISRQDAIDTVVFECGEWIGLAKEISKQLRQLPPVTPQRPKGKWIEYEVDIAPHPLHCSICGFSNHHISNRYIREFRRCPDCGAEMED